MKRQFRMTKIRWAIVIVIWLILVSCPLLLSNSKRQQIPPVRTDAVVTADITSYVSGPATVEPRVSVDVSANIMGKVTAIYVEEGQPVTKGDLLLELEQTQYRAGRTEAGAAYRSAVRSLELSETKWKTAKEVFARKQELFNKNLISREQYDLAQTQFEAERTEYDLARNNVVRARAALVQAKDSFDKTIYTAPLDGVVTALNVEEGEFTVVGTLNTPGTVMLTVADLAAMQVVTDIDETDIVDLRVGHPASVTVDAFPDTIFRGEVIEIASSAKEEAVLTGQEKTSADFEVTVLLGGDTTALRPGMTATADLITAKVENVVAVPIQALVTRTREQVEAWKESRGKSAPGKKGSPEKIAAESDLFRSEYVKGVFILEEEKPFVRRARFVPVEAGIMGDRYVEIKKGLKSGETIIAGPYKTLRQLDDGDLVRLEPRAAEPEES
ncbi:MAG: efflux RND transporter periplasmic adaptor subunit [Candidatus Coatesbacteria bacterium]|nr:MAG: efflux RND transporter periplasmic adaptor subunit [Candidatus Coatesbacteria bacterium]